ARLQATAAPDAPAPMIRTSTGSFFILVPWHVLFRHCEERQRRSNPPLPMWRHGLLRFARNDGW
ncbi:MAG: hypothetical protein ACK5AX_36780, partial [Bradyrhizobium sp.]|uniref:hypothetical protein n=1 Tax=Bradyrhizobium sp. TaxID=376 RepID=UPI00391D5A20